MQNFINKTFNKKKAVKVYTVTKDRRFKCYWRVPTPAGVVTVGEFSFILSKDSMLLQNNVPTYVFNVDSAEPINLVRKRAKHLSAEEFHLAIDSHVAKDILKASGGSSLSVEFIITLLVIVLGFGGLFYVFNGQFEELRLIIEQIQTTTTVIGG